MTTTDILDRLIDPKEGYELIGNLLARLHSKARLSLQQAAERH